MMWTLQRNMLECHRPPRFTGECAKDAQLGGFPGPGQRAHTHAASPVTADCGTNTEMYLHHHMHKTRYSQLSPHPGFQTLSSWGTLAQQLE